MTRKKQQVSRTAKLFSTSEDRVKDARRAFEIARMNGRKVCDRCGDTEWPCFLVDALCRMCQARRRDEVRTCTSKEKP